MSTLKVASWNIRKCVGLDWRRDPRRTVRVIGGLDADVVALQEVDKRLGHRPAALPRHLVLAETELEPVDVDGHEASLGWHGNAVLVRKGVEVADAHEIHLPGFEPRGALIVDLHRRGVNWRFVAVHLGLMRRSRRQQMAVIREALSARAPLPTVIAGDFNEWSPTLGFEPLAAYQVCAPGLTFHTSRPLAPLDRFVVSPDIRIETADVFSAHETRLASDHLPIAGKMRLRS